MHSIGICENQIYVVGKDLRRPAFVEYVNANKTKAYCVHGSLDDSSDCKEIPNVTAIPVCKEDVQSTQCAFARSHKYDFHSLKTVKCLCDKGTYCKDIVSKGNMASASSAIISRIALGTALDAKGPVRVQSSLLGFTAVMVALSSGINSPWSYVALKFLIGFAGATFVTSQFWCSLMFAPYLTKYI